MPRQQTHMRVTSTEMKQLDMRCAFSNVYSVIKRKKKENIRFVWDISAPVYIPRSDSDSSVSYKEEDYIELKIWRCQG